MSQTTINNMNHPIDVVIAWVDGSDPKLKEKRERYADENKVVNAQGAQTTRFASNNEIRYCVLSILKFAPFVRNIFIVTDEQDPNIHDDVKRYFPERLASIRIVDHKEIFRGYEEYLPTFNSTSIESMIWRIEDLSENFVYFNDDIFLVRDVQPDEWFINKRPILRGRWVLAPYKKVIRNKIKINLNRFVKNNHSYTPKFSFFLGQWNAASLLGMKIKYFLNGHTPHVFSKSTFEKFFTLNNDLLRKNISYRFRNQDQFNITTLANHLEIFTGNRKHLKPRIGYLNPAIHSPKRFNRKFRQCETDLYIKSICVQSLDMASTEYQNRIFKWMDKILGLEIEKGS